MTERIDIVVSERGSRVVRRNIQDIGDSSRSADQGVQLLQRALYGLGGALSLRKIVQTIDSFNQLQNSLKIAGVATDNLASSTDRLLSIANKTKQDLGAVGTLYSRLSGASKDLGASQEQLFTFVEAVGASLAVNNTEAGTAAGALLQLSQAMGGAVIQAQEFNSLIDGARPLLVAAAQNIDAAGGSVSRLKQLVNEGSLTAEQFFQGVLAGAPDLLEKLASAQTLVGQSLVVLNNQFTVWLGRSEAGQALNRVLANTFLFLAENLDTVAKAAISVAAGFVLISGGSRAIALATTAVRALTVAIAANPIGFLLIALTSAVTALTLFRDEISLGVDKVTTFGDLMRALGEVVGAAFNKLLSAAKATFGPLIDLLSDFVSGVDLSVIGVLKIVAKGVDAYIGLWRGAIGAVIELFKGLPSALGDLFTRAVNVLLSKITSFVNGAVELLEPLTSLAKIEIAPVDFQLTNENQGAAARLGENIGNAFKEGFQSSDFAETALGNLTTRAQQIANERLASAKSSSANLDEDGGKSSLPDKKLQDNLQSLVENYDKVFKAQQQYKDSILILDQAEQEGLITTERKSQIINLMSKQLLDSLNPLAAVNRELDLELQLLGLTSQAREIENQKRSIQQDLLNQGIILNERELEQLEEKLTLIQQETELSQAKAGVLNSLFQAQEQINLRVQAANQLLAEKTITEEQHTAVLRDAVQAQRELNFELGQATFADGFLMQMELMLAGVQNFTGEAGILFADYFGTLTNGFADAAAKSIVFGESFKESMGNAARQALAQLLSGLIKLGVQFLLNAALGQTAAAAATAASVAQAAAISAAWATPAALTSLASFGANSAPAIAGISTTVATANALALPKFAFGGDFDVAGTGGTDSQVVAFRATPGESVSIRTPTQNRDEARQSGGTSSGPTSITIVNLTDPGLLDDYLNTEEGNQTYVNKLRENGETVRLVVNEG